MNNAKPRWSREEMTEKLNVALRAAAFDAYTKALETGTPLVIWQNGMVVEIDPHSIAFEDFHRSPAAQPME